MSIISALRKDIPIVNIILNYAKDNNIEIYIVGGTVRDIILGKNIKDIDIVPFNILYSKFAFNIAKLIKAHAVTFKDNVRIIKGDIIIDISKPRGNNIKNDLGLRDFTINNLAIDLNGNIIGNTKDIKEKCIKIAYDNSFDDDPLRIIRAFRFVSSFNFNIDNKSWKKAIESKDKLKNIAIERIVEELRKIIKGKYFHIAIKLIIESNILSSITHNIILDEESAINIKASNGQFHIILAGLISGDQLLVDKVLKSFKLSSKEYKEIKTVKNKTLEIVNADPTDERWFKVFLWHNYKDLDNISKFIKAKYPNEAYKITIYNKIFRSIDINREKLISGKILQQMGFKPTKIFKTILDDVKEKLVLLELEEDNIKKYIKDKYISGE